MHRCLGCLVSKKLDALGQGLTWSMKKGVATLNDSDSHATKMYAKPTSSKYASR